MQINITVKYRLMPVQKNPKILIEKGMHTSMFIADSAAMNTGVSVSF